MTEKNIQKFRRRIRQLTGRSRGISMDRRMSELRSYLRGWMGYFGLAAQLKLPKLDVRWVAVTAQSRFEALKHGQIDLECGNTTPTLSRMKSVDFSHLIFVDASGFLVRGDARIGRAAELGGKRIAVIAGTTNEASLERALKQHSIAAVVVKVREAGEAVALLESGGADAFAGDKLKLVGAAAQARDPKVFALLPDDLSFEPYAFALPRNDTAMRATVNGALGEVFANLGRQGVAIDDAGAHMYNLAAGLFGASTKEMERMLEVIGVDRRFAYELPGAGDLYVTCMGGRTVRFGKLLGMGHSFSEARKIMAGETLESIEIIRSMSKAIPELEKRNLLSPTDLPFMRSLIDIVVNGQAVNLPLDTFFGYS